MINRMILLSVRGGGASSLVKRVFGSIFVLAPPPNLVRFPGRLMPWQLIFSEKCGG